MLVSDGKRPVARCGDKDKYTSVAAIDQPDVRVVVNPGGSNEAFAKANLSHATVTVFPDNKTIANEIVAGRQDVMVTDGVEVDHDALVHPELCAVAVAEPFTHFQNAFLLQKDPALKAAADAFLDGEIKSGAWSATVRRRRSSRSSNVEARWGSPGLPHRSRGAHLFSSSGTARRR